MVDLAQGGHFGQVQAEVTKRPVGRGKRMKVTCGEGEMWLKREGRVTSYDPDVF